MEYMVYGHDAYSCTLSSQQLCKVEIRIPDFQMRRGNDLPKVTELVSGRSGFYTRLVCHQDQ